jgi:DNA-binding GntR family transcriptional regulator
MTAATIDQLIADRGGRHRTATDFVEATLKAGIIGGQLRPGEPLRQEELAEKFGVSRMPLREALRRLEAQALVEFHPHRGAVVATLTATDAADVACVRIALESAALRLSVPLLDTGSLDRAEDLLHQMETEPDPERLGTLNRHFHLTLMSAARRPRLLALVEQHLSVAERYLRFQVSALGPHQLSQPDHADLLAACRAGDAETACAVTARHIGNAEADLVAFLTARETGGAIS